MINALNVNNSKTTTPTNGWIRSGRIGSSKNGSFSPAFVGRVDYTGVNGLVTGISAYYGDGSNLKNPEPGEDVSGLTTIMFDFHARYENGPFQAYGLYTQTNLDGTEKLSPVAVEKASGYYVNASYDLGSVVGIDYRMPVFAQYENWNPVEKTVDGLNESDFETETVTIGMNFFPAEQVVLKLDYEMNEVGNEETNTVSFGLGFIF